MIDRHGLENQPISQATASQKLQCTGVEAGLESVGPIPAKDQYQ